ncbi:unnamed protein product [Clavelina lepadiformis]|uniref:Uncharacterized protein n=1 Tax=Clavelina lepadiformis TaxID=159417 RepID=A0ABP0FBH0_CLALP
MGKKKMEDIITQEAQYFFEKLETMVGKPVALGLDYYNVIANIICVVALGRRFDYDDPKFREILHTLKMQYGDPKDAKLIMILIYFYNLLRFIPPFKAQMRNSEMLNMLSETPYDQSSTSISKRLTSIA